ncbi:MAG: DUF3592 domain-containing protein [Planctomycetes bacterium]|nr:DUF3592 domain-containing protein [Planctomycetota bacterium]
MSDDDDLERSSEDATGALVGAAVLGLVALVAFGFFGHGLLEAWAARGWLEAPGRRRERLGTQLHDRDEDGAWERVAHLPVGATVTVFYDPLDPSRSVLEPRVDLAGTLLAGFLGLFASAFGAGFLRRGLQPVPRLRRRRRGGAAPEAVT